MKRIVPPSDRRQSLPEGPALISVGAAGLRVWFFDEYAEIEDPKQARTFLRALTDLRVRVFTSSKLKTVIAGLGAQHFEGTLARRRLVRIKLDGGPVIYSTRRMVPPSERGFAELGALWDFCGERGVAFGSASWTSEQLFRSTLSHRLRFHARVGRKGARGGRKSFFASGTYRNVDYVDLRAAYPAAMVAEPIPTRLDYLPGSSIDHPVGLSLATVTVPDDLYRFPPLYEVARFGMLWQTGKLRDWYPLRELRMARDAGCRVEPDLVYVGRDYREPFDAWLQIMVEARELPGSAGRLGKIIANTLWGTFANGSETMVCRFADEYGEKIDLASVRVKRPPPPEAAFVACEISGRVRERMFRELVPSLPIYVDTDGGIIRRERALPSGMGDGLGEWSVRESFERLELVGIGAYIGHRFNGTKSTILAGLEGTASTLDVRRFGALGGGSTIADTSREGFKGVKLREREPWVFDAAGEPVPLDYQWPLDQMPGDWSVIPPELAGLPDFAPVPVAQLRDNPELLPISYVPNAGVLPDPF